MTWFTRCCALALAITGSLLSAAEREIFFTAAPPSLPGISADDQRRLHVGRVVLDVTESESNMLDQSGGWGHARLVAVWKTNGQGQHLDADGLVTTDPARYQLDYYQVDWLGSTFRDDNGEPISTTLVTPSVPARPAFRFEPTMAKVGEVYWYEGTTAHVIDLTHRTAFLTPGDVQEFRRWDLHVSTYNLYRARENPYATGSQRPDFGIERSATRVLARGSYDGGHFGVVTAAKAGYVFAGVACSVNGEVNPDPYLFTGVQLVIPQAMVQPDGKIAWPVTLPGGVSALYAAAPDLSLPPTTLREPTYSIWMRLITSRADVLELVTAPANRSEIDGQNVDELVNAVVVARNGGNAQDEAVEVKAALANGEYIRIEDDKVVTTEQATYSDVNLDGLRSSVATGFLDVAATSLQTSTDLLAQVAPVAQEPQPADTASLIDAISIVEAKMYEQTPTSLPLGRNYPPRYAAMQPAGWLASYLEGSPTPGHGTNPYNPFPANAETGAPAYDLNGDGSVDRFGTTDPYQNGFNQIILQWKVTASGFKFGSYNNNQNKCAFAVYAQNKDKPEDRKLLFVGHDGIIYVSRKDRWTGTNYHSFALRSLIEATGDPDTYRFALRYQGATPVDSVPDPLPVPQTHTVTWQNTTTVTPPGGPAMTVITETGVETVYLYPDLEDEQTLVTASFSDATFTPRATDGRPVMAARYERTITPYLVTGTVSTPQAPTSSTVYFPAEFRPENLEVEEEPVIPVYENSFMWDYTLSGRWPTNYQRGYKFPRGRLAVTLNDNEVIARFGGDLPLQSVTSLVESGGVDFTIKWAPPTDGSEPDLLATNIRSHTSGQNTFDLLSGAGYFLYKGKWVSIASETGLRRLIRDMWEWDMYQPRTVYTVLHVDGNPSKPLLNTVRTPTASTARDLVDINTGVLSQDLQRVEGANANANALRRSELMQGQWFFFSSAKGREHEIEMALRTPKETRLYCVEWDDFKATQKLFAGYNVQYLMDDESERKVIGEIQTKIYGKTHLQGRTNTGSVVVDVTGESGVADIALANPGKYVFTDADLLYGMPCNHLIKCALLDDLQYGDPKPTQWVSNHKMQIRHPMVIFYDDRWSAVVAAYGMNADPRQWTAKWNTYSSPVDAAPTDLCKVAFEMAATRPMLIDLYDRMNRSEYEAAREGDIVIPPRPEYVAQPVAPTRPAEWNGGEIVYPPVVADPGLRPELTVITEPVWTKTRAEWGGSRGGTSNSTISGLPAWTTVYPITHDLQQAHDGWIAQFAYPRMTVTQASPQRITDGVNNWGIDPLGQYAYVLGERRVAPGSAAPSTFPELAQSFTPGQPWWNIFRDRDTATINFTLPVDMSVAVSFFAYDDVQCYIDDEYYARYDGDRERRNMERTFVLPMEAGAHSALATTNNNGSDLGVRGLFVRLVNPTLTLARSIAAADLAAYRAHLAAHDAAVLAWTQRRAEYDAYLARKAEVDQILVRYQDWLENYPRLLEQYERDNAAYQNALVVYQRYVTALDAWNAANQSRTELLERWQRYRNAREAWVYLVEHRAAEPGVNWGTGGAEPILQGYTFWKTQPECTCE